MKNWADFKEKWVVDYEFYSKDGNPPIPVCYVAKNIDTGDTIKHWIEAPEEKPLYSIDSNSLFIAYFASAELGCHQALNFGTPPYIIDLFAEFRTLTNGLKTPSGSSLLGACNFYGLSSSDAAYKNSMRNIILRGHPYNEREKRDILLYCEKDVEMTAELFTLMQPDIELNFALLRGRYMAAVASMEFAGIPIDTAGLQKLKDCWDIIKEEIILRVDQNYHVFEGTTFKIDKFQKYLDTHGILWEYTPSGLPKTDNKFLQKQAKIYPELKPLQELKYTLGQLKLNDLQVGEDGRNRCLLSPFRSITSRNQPSTSKFIFGNATWLRYLIKPEEGRAIAYIDYAQQELAVAAALSGDKNLLEAYQSGDPYLAFAKAAGAIPPEGTKEKYPEIRDKFKTCMLALNYGMSTETFALSANIPLAEAKYMVKLHKQKYKRYWEWDSSFIDIGLLSGQVETRHHWRYNTRNAKYRSLMNWPMQSNGADILRLAISLCIDNDIRVIAPVHDAILIEDSIENIDNSVRKTQNIMEKAAEFVINLKIKTDVKTVCYPDRYNDPRGKIMWENIWEIIDNINPLEIQQRQEEKILLDAPLEINFFEPAKPKTPDNLTRMRRSQKMMQLENFSEKAALQRIKKISNFSHMEIVHLIREAREIDFDLESEIDWTYSSYNDAKKLIQQRKKDFGVYRYG